MDLRLGLSGHVLCNFLFCDAPRGLLPIAVGVPPRPAAATTVAYVGVGIGRRLGFRLRGLHLPVAIGVPP